MKITAKQYAIGLFESIEDASDNKVKEVVKSFARVLIENNDTAQVEKIIRHFNIIWNETKGIIEAEIVSARKLDTNLTKLLEEYIKKIAKSKDINVVKKIDTNIIGGVIMKYGDKVLDASLKTKLNQFSDNLKS